MTIERISIGDTSLNVNRQGQGPPLFFVHGFPLDHTTWQGQIAEFAKTHTVIAPDLRGFGGSDVSGADLTMDRFADDLAMLLDAIGVAEPVAFCGLSMGGYIAWQFWKKHRERLGRLILCDTRAVADPPEAAQARLEMAEKVLADGAAVIADAMTPKLFAERTFTDQPEIVEQTRHVMLSTAPETIAAALRGMAVREDVTGWLKEIDKPTLVVCGTHDVISPVSEMRLIAEKIPGAGFCEIPDVGHMAHLEDPGSVNQAIARFLASDR